MLRSSRKRIASSWAGVVFSSTTARRCRDRNGIGDGGLVGTTQRQGNLENAEHAGNLLRTSMQQRERLALLVVRDLDIGEGDAIGKTRAKRLEDGLLGGKVRRIAHGRPMMALAIGALVIGEDAVDKAGGTLEDILHALDLDNIHPKPRRGSFLSGARHSTVTDFARLRGLSTSQPRSSAI